MWDLQKLLLHYSRVKGELVSKELIKRLHNGATVEEVQEEFDHLTNGVTATEIAEMEQALVTEGMPVADIQRLCDVHAAVFKGSIEDIHKDDAVQREFGAGHPILTLKAENAAIQTLIDDRLLPSLKSYTQDNSAANNESLTTAITKLMAIDRHYSRKENLIFPIMEKYDITAPPQVMWGIDDEIRDKIKSVLATLESESIDTTELGEAVNDFVAQIGEMIFKEEEIMIPMVLDKFSFEDWVQIENSSAEIGYTLIPAPVRWSQAAQSTDNQPSPQPSVAADTAAPGMVQLNSKTKIKFDAGSLTAEEINAILNTVPLDMTFVGADDKVRYFTQGKERVFDRPVTIIGRQVKHCHPPKSVSVVEQIVADLKSGKKDNEDFWIKMGDMFVYIRYFAVRNKTGEFLGTLEVTQNIKPITELEGEKRLMT